MTVDQDEFPAGCSVEWDLSDKSIEFIEGGVSSFKLNEVLQPCETVHKKSHDKLATVPFLDWELRYGDYDSSSVCKRVAVSLRSERSEDDDKYWIHFYHDSWLFGKWDCTEWSPQFTHVIECLELKVKESETWSDLLRANDENDGQEPQAKKNKRKRRKVVARDKTTYKYKDVKLHPLVMLLDSSGNWMIKIQLSLFHTADAGNHFGAETNRLLSEVFIKEEPRRFLSDSPVTAGTIVKEFNSSLVNYTKHILKGNTTFTTPSVLDVELMPFQLESVDWMLRKEGFYDEPFEKFTTTEQLEHFLNEHVSYGYVYMPINRCFWNKITGYVLPIDSAWDIYDEWVADTSNRRRAKGLIAEEMGLGKTIEILSLITSNVRDLSNESSTFISSINDKKIKRVKTNLIVCPSSILEQWIDEIDTHLNRDVLDLKVYHYPGLKKMKQQYGDESSEKLAERLAEYDVVMCSYQDMSAEVHYAEFVKTQRPSRDSTRKYDYSSPLSIVEFFRIILDEVQLLGFSTANASRCANLIHRVHTWGVSGTPVQWRLDIQNILTYLQFHPFQDIDVAEILHRADRYKVIVNDPDINTDSGPTAQFYAEASVGGYRGSKMDFAEVIGIFHKFNLAIRHSKQSVQHQINIPKQISYLMPVELNPIEQDNYVNLWDSFLRVSGYDSSGNGVGNLELHELSRWLDWLRMTCCHASMSTHSYHNSGVQKWRDTDELKDMDAILNSMKEKVLERIYGLQRDNYTIQIQLGQVKMEIENDPEAAGQIFQKVIADISRDLKDIYNIENMFDLGQVTSEKWSQKDTTNIRLLFHTVHQAFFFLATSYYQLGSKKLDDVDASNGAIGAVEDAPKKKTHSSKNSEPTQYSDIYSKDELSQINKFQDLEKKNYETAEKLRRELLSDRITDVDAKINEVREWFKNSDRKAVLDSIEPSKGTFGSVLAQVYVYQKIAKLLQLMDAQSKQFNSLSKDLEELSYEPIVKQYESVEEAEKSEEYGKSVEAQDKIFSTLDILERILKNRDDVVARETDLDAFELDSAVADVDSKFHEDLLKTTIFVNGDSYKMLLNHAENDMTLKRALSSSKHAQHNIHDFINCYEMEITRITKENQEMRAALKKFNDIYNAKTNYYSYLQRISDSLTPLSEQSAAAEKQIISKVTSGTDYDQNCKLLNNLRSRVRYLDALAQLKDSIANGENITCAICYSDIYTGSILKCGHYFCVSCVTHWFDKNTSCPMCKDRTSSSEVYHFKFREEEQLEEDNSDATNGMTHEDTESAQNGDGAKAVKEPGTTIPAEDNETVITRKYRKFPALKKVSSMTLGNSWGGKVDQVLKLILYIKEQHLQTEPHKRSPQIVIYSLHPEFLNILCGLLASYNVRYARPTRGAQFTKEVNVFRRDPECTCLFLTSNYQTTGLTLINARHLMILDPILEISTELQAISRIHRIGQKHETYVWNFMVRNTVEESIMKYKAVLDGKRIQRKKELQATTNEAALQQAEQELDEQFSLANLYNGSGGKKLIWHCLFENCQ
ncbi:unnamed protein product [Kluyveromyces dobzhanskii CBS 2104]|uniref:WGS project CCBQ000000000 data, contig 00014 n=1 Tax=Kluyveromyces dobzhanskii CBS 2104 TaxID=1427455 RepID=A0A0A8L975_9SACH|nr:unnamed protein product [Kluyveromyces dobzhanskii CBS 2104]